MSLHIGAKKGEIAETVLLPGDPLRAKHVADTMLTDVICYNEVRGMYGFTGNYKGQRISIQGAGMGIPSSAIYINELISDYGVKNLIRVGTCGALQENLKLGQVIIALSASSDSNVNRVVFKGLDFAPTVSYELLTKATKHADQLNINPVIGSIFSSDTFYDSDPNRWDVWREHGILGVEMETSVLYTLAAKFGVNALSILTVSDNIVTGDFSSSEEREKSYTDMMELALGMW